MDFEKVQRKHIIQGIKDFEEKGIPPGFKNSTTYNIIFEGKEYPPKVIMVYANYHASGRKIEWYFKGGEGTECFNVLKNNGFVIEKKKKGIMNIFFGKISGKFDTDQIEEGYYKSDKGSSWFGDLKIGDYAFIIGGDRIQLWQAKNWGEKDGVECLWFDILNNNLNIKLNKFTSLNFFKITTNLAVLTSRSARNKAFFKLELLRELDVNYLSDTSTYENDELYRKIIIHKDETFIKESSQDLQFFYDSGELKFFPNDFTQQKIISNFRNNLKYGGKGAVRKDNVINTLKSKELNPSAFFTNEEISIRSIYDTLFCPYESKYTSELITEQIDNMNDNQDSSNILKEGVLNAILFGPPGTGKTFNTINEALRIVDPKFYEENKEDRKNLTNRFKELLIKKWEEPKGQIAFCTFHQSFSYEDFVEGIKPETKDGNVTYDIQNGIFKKICQLADSNLSTLKLRKEGILSWDEDKFRKASFYKLSLGDSQKYEDREIYEFCRDYGFIAVGFGEDIDFSGMSESQIREKLDDEGYKESNAQMLNYFVHYLKKGNYVLISNGNQYVRALGKVTGDYEFNPNTRIRYAHFRKVEWIFVDENIPIEEIYEVGLSQKTIYKIDEAKLKPEFFIPQGQIAKIEVEEEKKENNYVLIIDEINRGNVSSIFGELITLIEKDKRAGKDEELEVILPYSKQPFKVPHNVYLIGTMNTADRSVEALDTALRRRFNFKEFPPKPDLTVTEGKSGAVNGIVTINGKEIKLKKLLITINNRIEKLIDKDHKIGHSYFLNVDSEKSLKLCFKNKVIPLLEEYFFGDFGKIGLVLGNTFVEKKKNSDFTFSEFDGYESDIVADLLDRPLFKIRPQKEWDFSAI